MSRRLGNVHVLLGVRAFGDCPVSLATTHMRQKHGRAGHESTDFAEVWSSVSVGGKLGPPTSARNWDAGENERKTPTPDATNRHRARKCKSEKKNDARDDTGRRKEVEQKRTVSAQRR